MRLIDADKAIERIESRANSGQWSELVVYGLKKACSYLKNEPTIKSFTLADIEEQYRKGLEKGLEEAEIKHGKWEYLKEHITDMRDSDGESHLNQKQLCQFILNLMGVIEEEGDEK